MIKKFIERPFLKVVEINIIVDILVLLFAQVLCDCSSIFNIILFIPDIFNAITFILLIYHKEDIRINKNVCMIIMLVFTIYAFFSFVWLNGSLSDGLRRFRYILTGCWMYYCYINYMDFELIKKICKILYISLWIHTLLIFHQFFILKTGIDCSNGLFGFLEYNNASQGIYCLAIALMGLSCYLFGTAPRYRCIFMMILPFITCALSEIKAFYVEFFISAFVIMFYSRNIYSKRKNKMIYIIIFLVISGLMAYKILEYVMPQNLYAFKSFSSFITYESYETARAGGYGRYSQLQYVFKNVFNSNLLKSIFGMGIAYRRDVIVYEASKTFSNFGIIGLLLLLSIFVCNIIFLWKKKEKTQFIALSIGFSVSELLSLFMWNATLNRMSYLCFLIIAFGYVANQNGEILNDKRIINIFKKDV